MKKLIAFMVATLVAVLGFSETIHVKKAYLMEKDSDGSVYKIRIQEEDGYHDWYVVGTDKPWLFYGYESHDGIYDEIIVDETIDIAVID